MIECSRFPFCGAVALCATSLSKLMQCTSRLLIAVTGDTVILECRCKRFMPERLDLFCGPFPFVIGVAVNTGVVGKAFVEKNLATVVFQHRTSNRFQTDVTLFVTTDALH